MFCIAELSRYRYICDVVNKVQFMCRIISLISLYILVYCKHIFVDKESSFFIYLSKSNQHITHVLDIHICCPLLPSYDACFYSNIIEELCAFYRWLNKWVYIIIRNSFRWCPYMIVFARFCWPSFVFFLPYIYSAMIPLFEQYITYIYLYICLCINCCVYHIVFEIKLINSRKSEWIISFLTIFQWLSK